ncbi:spore cortex biosynthesis protein YabQ [Mesobacillus subterraneus]|uniref:spore cortex biosynthesis protein YabQ n=1 Tax=Mesobacillus subterraneus TaxID=285983 RepID=UPI003531DC3F
MTLSTQFLTMLAMIWMGTLFGASLDTHNRFLKRSKRKSWIVFINDILFWVFQGLSIFYVLFSVNMGELRFYIFLALLCGFAAYQSLFKNMYLKVLERGHCHHDQRVCFYRESNQDACGKAAPVSCCHRLITAAFDGEGAFTL